MPSRQLQMDWDKFAKAIEEAFDGLADSVAAIAAAQAAADAANAAAVVALDAVDEVTAEQSLVNSYVTTSPLTGTDAGANATVTIAGHDRVYGDATTITLTGGTITAARIEFPNAAAARNPRTVAHEIGHVLGFGHAPSGLMCPTACGASDFSPTEQAVLFSMLLRTPGTAPLDNDRALGARSADTEAVIRCDLR